MKRKERYIVSLDEVIVTRGTDYADIEYKEPGIAYQIQTGSPSCISRLPRRKARNSAMTGRQ